MGEAFDLYCSGYLAAIEVVETGLLARRVGANWVGKIEHMILLFAAVIRTLCPCIE